MKAFISYSHHDDTAFDGLQTHLSVLRDDGLIKEFFDRKIPAGKKLNDKIREKLEECELFLLLVSPHYFSSDYCRYEMTRALERQREGDAQVVPIIVEPCDWLNSSLRELKAVPKDGKPISTWTNANSAYLDVIQELRRILNHQENTLHKEISSLTSHTNNASVQRYKVKREFDKIDRSDFCEKVFVTIRDYFESAVQEINNIESIRARYYALSAISFGCTIINKVKTNKTAHITVHSRGQSSWTGDIYYSFEENSPPGTSNGGFSIQADEYELFLCPESFSFLAKQEKLTAKAAAELIWAEFISQAGITYA